MPQLARTLGEIWLCMLSLLVIVFGLIIIVTEGFGVFWAVFSPFNFAGLGNSTGLGPARNRSSCSCKKFKKISPFKLGYYHARM